MKHRPKYAFVDFEITTIQFSVFLSDVSHGVQEERSFLIINAILICN